MEIAIASTSSDIYLTLSLKLLLASMFWLLLTHTLRCNSNSYPCQWACELVYLTNVCGLFWYCELFLTFISLMSVASLLFLTFTWLMSVASRGNFLTFTWLMSVASRGNFLLLMKVTPACWSSSWDEKSKNINSWGKNCLWESENSESGRKACWGILL